MDSHAKFQVSRRMNVSKKSSHTIQMDTEVSNWVPVLVQLQFSMPIICQNIKTSEISQPMRCLLQKLPDFYFFTEKILFKFCQYRVCADRNEFFCLDFISFQLKCSKASCANTLPEVTEIGLIYVYVYISTVYRLKSNSVFQNQNNFFL